MSIYDEPYFEERLDTLGYKKEYHDFCSMIAQKFNYNEYDFFEYASDVQNKAISIIILPIKWGTIRCTYE